ncbi:MAG: ROK family protein [Anaerolineales bacterium]|nr:ROK family protein [Anaerolineales bacterium]
MGQQLPSAVNASELDRSQHLALAIDIGGSKAEIAVIDAHGTARTLAVKQPVPFGQDGRADPARLIELFAPHVVEAQRLPGQLDGIGLSICGNIDPDTGEAVLVPNLHWRYLPFGPMVAARFGLSVYAATDVRMAALAEAIWGVARGVRYFAWCTIGTGYGGYLFLDGKLYGGTHGFAGNFGHNTIDEVDGYPCGCGRRGCLETYVAGPAIARAGQAALDAGRSPELSQICTDGRVVTHMVFQAATAGDPACRAIIDEVVRRVAIGLGGVVNTLDLDMIVVGGGVAHGDPELVPRINRKIRDYLMTVEAARDLRVVMESLPNSALYGAAADVFIRSGVLELETG